MREIEQFKSWLENGNISHWRKEQIEYKRDELRPFEMVFPMYKSLVEELYWNDNKNGLIYSFLKADRESKVAQVNTITKEIDFIEELVKPESNDYFVKQFKQ